MYGLTLRLPTLNLAGLVALFGPSWFAIRGPSGSNSLSYIDALFLALRIHSQEEEEDLSPSELPMAGVIRTGGTFHVWNSATVSYLHSIGRSGHLVTARVLPHSSSVSSLNRFLQSLFIANIPSTLLYLLAPALTVVTAVFLGYIQDWWGLGVLVSLVLSRLINAFATMRIWRDNQRSMSGKTSSVDTTLFILCTQNRWILLRGAEKHIRALMADLESLDESMTERFAGPLQVSLVYVAVFLSFLSSIMGSMAIACLLLCSSAILALYSTLRPCLRLPDCSVCVEGVPKKYTQRLDMAKELIKTTGRDDWAIGLGLITPENSVVGKDGIS
ncbi:hypothetical protein IW261DRAFT_1502334 [Armillaria novae-zelandiae]|uniref:Uncharacterized protein n=1 Tax=Armillaria novae-zelandiae TaxID=153914 RepID=A0AA39NY96_9AGAR|nr:hypothetical protein IW261DRAFT_1502334 [Armillaria novae-zelandiae]